MKTEQKQEKKPRFLSMNREQKQTKKKAMEVLHFDTQHTSPRECGSQHWEKREMVNGVLCSRLAGHD